MGLLDLIQTELVEPLAALEDQRNLDLAAGVFLDHIGSRLGRNRPNIGMTIETVFFGFEGSDGVGFDQAPFRSSLSELVAREAVGDLTYRAILRAPGAFDPADRLDGGHSGRAHPGRADGEGDGWGAGGSADRGGCGGPAASRPASGATCPADPRRCLGVSP